MPDHLVFSKNMTGADFDGMVRDTFLGQAHFAGTGPEGATCRQCAHWYNLTRDGFLVNAGYYGASHPERPRELKRSRCNADIGNKADRLVPHYAGACRLFVANHQPLPAIKPKQSRRSKRKK